PQAIRLVTDGAEDLLLLSGDGAVYLVAQQGDVAANDAQRSLEFVRCDGYELRLHPVEHGQIVRHEGEGAGEVADLIRPIGRNVELLLEVALGDSRHPAAQLTYRPQQVTTRPGSD